jgi:hypothetical protein
MNGRNGRVFDWNIGWPALQPEDQHELTRKNDCNRSRQASARPSGIARRPGTGKPLWFDGRGSHGD